MKVFFKSIGSVKGYVTKDNSLIYELLNPENSPVNNISVALAIVKQGQYTLPHKHIDFDEIYFVVSGEGKFLSENLEREVKSGDLIFIPRGSIHYVKANKSELKILCICIPPYSHDSTIIVR